MPRKKLLFVDMYPISMTYKLLYFLRNYFDITLIVLQSKKNSNRLLEDYKKLGIKIYFFDPYGCKKEKIKLIFRLIIERLKGYPFVLGKAGPNWPTYLLFKIFHSSKKIYFPYDIFLFLWKDQSIRPWTGRMFEKSNLKNADFILHKGPENQFDFVRRDEVKRIKGKLIQFISCFDDWIVPINKNKTKEPSLVYIGICPDKEISNKYSFSDLFKKISDSGVNLHVYSMKNVENQGFIRINRKNIFYHDPIPNKILNKEISKYHYGVCLGFFNRNLVDDRFLKTTLGNKVISYLEAGIPIIVNDETEFSAELVRKYNCGIVISENDLPNLNKIIKKQKYSELLRGVKMARENMLMSKDMKKMIQILNIK
jgi:hypothetical protein